MFYVLVMLVVSIFAVYQSVDLIVRTLKDHKQGVVITIPMLACSLISTAVCMWVVIMSFILSMQEV